MLRLVKGVPPCTSEEQEEGDGDDEGDDEGEDEEGAKAGSLVQALRHALVARGLSAIIVAVHVIEDAVGAWTQTTLLA
eukprot:2936461-Alexandrium_andersonii.AAC.1